MTQTAAADDLRHALPARDVAAVRRFTRFYTQRFGVLGGRLYGADMSLTEARVLYEIANRPAATAGELGRELGVDAGYMSRIVRKFEQRGVMTRKASPKDGRVQLIGLTAKGRATFARIDRASADQVAALLHDMTARDRARLAAAMAAIEESLGGKRRDVAPIDIALRSHRPGDMGWVVAAHGDLYAREYGWDISFEALVAEIVAKFLREFDERRERCWIAETAGEPVGCAFIVRASDEAAKLRLLIVDPKARGFGLGRRLVDECIAFSRAKGYRKITLWTNDVLHAARAIYEKAGFRLVASENHRSFGKDLVGETWELTL
jgi:DNA-binding MarR family transcriptional regulator/N-acetylglutamate synthase-like GNAT family acetyltransferase